MCGNTSFIIIAEGAQLRHDYGAYRCKRLNTLAYLTEDLPEGGRRRRLATSSAESTTLLGGAVAMMDDGVTSVEEAPVSLQPLLLLGFCVGRRVADT